MDVYHVEGEFFKEEKPTELYMITAKTAKEFRRQFYMGRRSPVLKPNYVANKSVFWKEVNTFFEERKLQKTFKDYTFMCGFDVFKGTEIIMPRMIMCTEGNFNIVRNDVAWMVTNKVDALGLVRTKSFYHMCSNQAKLEGYAFKVRGIMVYDGDTVVCQRHMNNFTFLSKRCKETPTKFINLLNSLINN